MNRKRAPRIRYQRVLLVLFLIICFPAGLIVLWSDRCRWPHSVKCLLSVVVAAALIAVMVPQTLPPERMPNGIRLVGAEPDADIHGPEAPEERLAVEIYSPRHTAVVVVPSPTPIPIYVYCNDGGRYYHSEECRYVKKTTPHVTLSAALHAGYKQCKECNAPSENEE